MNTKSYLKYDVVVTYEVTLIDYCVKHSYASLHCGNKLMPTLFGNCPIANKLCCGRKDKIRINCKECFPPKSVNKLLEFFNSSESSQYFTIDIEASNKENRKMFLICMKYLIQTLVLKINC